MDMELLEELKEKVPLLEVIGKKAEGMDQNFSLFNKMDQTQVETVYNLVTFQAIMQFSLASYVVFASLEINK